MRYGSVCSGIEAATVAWHDLGWSPAWLAEIEPFPSAVLKHHYPDVTNLGDMTRIAAGVLSGSVEAPDVLVGGTPCQAFSMAGLRKSLEDDRGQLSIAYIHLADAIESVRASSGLPPPVIVWENVPGVLSTQDNAFGCFLAGLAGEECELQPSGKKWTDAGCVYGPKRTVAWRVLDAQYFGLAQRRRRVFVVASSRKDIDPAAILLERDGLRRDSSPRRETGKDIAKCLRARAQSSHREDSDNFVTARMVAFGEYAEDDTASTVKARDCKDATDLVSYGIPGNWIGRKPEHGGNAVEPPIELSPCLTGTDKHGVAHPLCVHGTQDPCVSDNVAFALGRNNGQENAIAQPVIAAFKGGQGSSAGSIGYSEHIAPTLPAADGGNRTPTLLNAMAVRRLTPVECERLQGFPDNYTAIPWRNKLADECPDGPRYKALGNSMAVPVMRWIGQRIDGAIHA